MSSANLGWPGLEPVGTWSRLVLESSKSLVFRAFLLSYGSRWVTLGAAHGNRMATAERQYSRAHLFALSPIAMALLLGAIFTRLRVILRFLAA